MHYCMNVVTEADGRAAAVLLRALEPIAGLRDSAKGPGRLCRAMAIDRGLNGHDLLSRDLYICAPPVAESIAIARTRRIGVDYAGSWARRLLRFCVKDSPHLSRP